jgi:hypothetical protein
MFGYSARQKLPKLVAPLAAIQVYIWRSLDAYQQSAINHQPKWNKSERFRSKTERSSVPLPAGLRANSHKSHCSQRSHKSHFHHSGHQNPPKPTANGLSKTGWFWCAPVGFGGFWWASGRKSGKRLSFHLVSKLLFQPNQSPATGTKRNGFVPKRNAPSFQPLSELSTQITLNSQLHL